MKKLHSSNAGFSLVELIVAVVILGIITVPLMHTLVTGAQTARKSADASDVSAAAQSIIELVRARGASEVYENMALIGAEELTDLEDFSDIVTDESTESIKYGVIRGFSSGTRHYDALVKIDASLADNSEELAKSSAMDITLNLRFADGKARNDYREQCKDAVFVYDDEGNEVFDHYEYPDEDQLERTGIELSAARTDAGGGKYNYTVTASFSYGAKAGSGESFNQTYSSSSELNNVAPTEYGQAAFSVYLLYDAFVRFDNDDDSNDGVNRGDKIEISNLNSDDADFNVFLVNTSSAEQPAGFVTEVNYRAQRYSANKTCTRVFSNLPAAVIDYYPFKANTMQPELETTGQLVETAAEQRRFLAGVSLFSEGSLAVKPAAGEPERAALLSLEAEMLR